MDLLDELECLAQKCYIASCDEISDSDISRWQLLFDFTAEEAEAEITAHLHSLTRITISDEYWATIKEMQEPLGHDKESYAYFLAQQGAGKMPAKPLRQTTTASPTRMRALAKKRWLLQLDHTLDSSEKVQAAAHLSAPPRIVKDQTNATACFVEVDIFAKEAIEEYTYTQATRPFFIECRMPANKELSDMCVAPTLGLDATMPQHRLSDSTAPAPQQNTYPVPYFFYGTLAEEDRLVGLVGLDLETRPQLTAAKVRGGRVEMKGRYRGLVDGGQGDEVEGWMFLVENREQEDALRGYEGDEYEVVRCEIFGEEGIGGVRGLTFKFC